MKCSLTFVVLLSQWLLIFSHADRILMLAPVCSKSHKISFMPIIEALAEKGHQVTVVTPFPPDNTIKNVREVVIENNIFTEKQLKISAGFKLVLLEQKVSTLTTRSTPQT